MKIIIPIDTYSKQFIYSIIVPQLKKELTLNTDTKYLKYMSDILGINLLDVIRIAINNIIVIESSNNYIITFNNTVKAKGEQLFYWLNTITYGTLSLKGTSFILEVFNKVRDSLNVN